ncbi:COFACTOR-INDEPENDENT PHOSPHOGLYCERATE MUTASE [Salix koriyanagi]|uniref:COFACTOR-INDEPENDENT PHOSPHOGLYCERATE MUTASE n=1 Tax=Salix koriyanagi TaxID=2511006 RepID=A0A9Q1A015_9ROSI|nr:COFACTOR-INDEPENDENT PHOSPHOGLYCERATE MUTASE [Salix koriyanagi]
MLPDFWKITIFCCWLSHSVPFLFAFYLQSNFATLDEETGTVISRRADRHFDGEGPVLCAALDGMKLPSFPEYEVRVRYATEHRCGVVEKGPRLSCNISGTDPLKDKRLLLQSEALNDSDEARHTAAVVNEVIQGDISYSDIDILEAPGATGDYQTLLTSKATVIARALSAPLMPSPNVFVPGEDEHKPGRPDGYDFGFLHIKVECRLRDFAGAVGGESIIMETSLDPFPLPAVKAGENLGETENAEKERSSKQLKAFSGDSVCELSEIAAARGCLGRFPGGQMMGIIKAFLELNTRAAPLRTSSWPGVLNKKHEQSVLTCKINTNQKYYCYDPSLLDPRFPIVSPRQCSHNIVQFCSIHNFEDTKILVFLLING